MFEIDDYIIYGNHGVCKVVEIGGLDISGFDKSKECYTLQPVFSKASTLYTPVDNEKVLMRKVISSDEAQDLIDRISDTELLWIENDKQREEAYKDALRTHDCTQWVRIIKTLFVRKQERLLAGKKLTFTDEKYLGIAKDCLYGELSIALDREKDDVEELVLDCLEQLNMV